MRIAAVFLPLLLLAGQAVASPRGPETGDLAPALLGQDRDGKPVTLDAYRGPLVVVTFWNSACKYCLAELPTLENLQQELGNERLQVIAVNVNDNTRDYKGMVRQMRDYAMVQSRDATGTVASAWDAQMFPNLWLLDGKGRVLHHHEGYFGDALPGILGEIRQAATDVAMAPAATAPAMP